MRRLLAAAAAALSSIGAAHSADTLSAGGLYGGPGQVTAVCYLYNAGNTTIELKGLYITDFFGVKQPLTIDECQNALGPRVVCGIAASVSSNLEYACRARVSNKLDMRGTFQMRGSGGTVLETIDLR